MPFSLENPDVTLSKTQRRALYDALLAAFTYEELDQLVYLELDEKLSQIATERANMATVATQFMQWLERVNRVGEFIDIAYRHRPKHALLRSLAKELGFMAEAPPKARLEQLLQQFAKEFDMAPNLPQDRQFERMLEAFAREMNLRPTVQINMEVEHERAIARQYADISLVLRWLSTAARRVCLISDGVNPVGTGFLVGRDSVLTTYSVISHLIGTERWAACRCRFDYVAEDGVVGPGATIPFATEQPLIDFSPYSPGDVSADRASELPTAAELDYALLRLAANAGDTRGWYSLTSVKPAEQNEMIYLVHHPAGQPLKLSHPPGKLYRLNGNGTRYEIIDSKTEPGSSGAPCLNETGQPVGLYHAKDYRVFRPEGLGKAIPLTLIRDLLLSRGVALT